MISRVPCTPFLFYLHAAFFDKSLKFIGAILAFYLNNFPIFAVISPLDAAKKYFRHLLCLFPNALTMLTYCNS